MKSTRSHSSLVLVFLVFNPGDLHYPGYKNTTNNNNHDNVYGAVITTKVIARDHPVHLMNVD